MPQPIVTRLKGVSFGNRQAVIAALQLGELVCLVREPTNAYDHNAIQVVGPTGDVLGYLAHELAATLAPQMDAAPGSWPAEVTAICDCGLPDTPLGVEVAFDVPEAVLLVDVVYTAGAL